MWHLSSHVRLTKSSFNASFFFKYSDNLAGASPTDFYGLSHNQEVLLRINNSTQSGSGKKTEHQQRTSLESQNKTVNKARKH